MVTEVLQEPYYSDEGAIVACLCRFAVSAVRRWNSGSGRGTAAADRGRENELLRRPSARTSDATVHTMSGCIMTNEKLRKIADELDSGEYDPWLRCAVVLPVTRSICLVRMA